LAFKCKVCFREFPSFQALGGHAWHHSRVRKRTPQAEVTPQAVPQAETPIPQAGQAESASGASGSASERALRTNLASASGSASGASGIPQAGQAGQAETPQAETPQAEFSAEPQAGQAEFDFSKILGKSEAEIEKEEKATEEGIDQLTNMVERFWNSQTETQAEGEPWKWTKEDSEMLKRTVMALDAKYGFIGKSLNYVPEIMLIALVINLVMKGLALRKARSGIPRRSSPESYQQATQQESATGTGTRTIDELNRLAEAEAERLNRERGVS
jgi:hypothetical protein